MSDSPAQDVAAVDDHWRLFVALEIPATTRAVLGEALSPMAATNDEHLKFVPSGSWHVTLAFLGSVHPSWSDVIERSVAVSASAVPAFDVALGRAGRFGRGLLFLGLDDEAFASVRKLGQVVREGLTANGVPFDTKPLHPHVTLARQRDRRGIGVSRSRLQEVDVAVAGIPTPEHLRWSVRTVSLMRSHLGGEVVRYEPLARLPLAVT